MSTSQVAAARDERLATLLGQLTEARRCGARADVEALAGQHPDLADELRALWVAVQLAEEFAPARSAEPATLPLTPRTGTPPADGLPRQFGEFTLLEEVGRGGMGVVYRARQASLHRTVALKVIQRGERARFQFEAEAAA